VPREMTKDPNAKLPFSVDWTAWLAAEQDTAESAAWTVPAGLTQEVSPAPSLSGGKTTVWLSGGTADQNYDVTCRLTTTGGRVDERTITIQVRQR
jgi:hypothetical protein